MNPTRRLWPSLAALALAAGLVWPASAQVGPTPFRGWTYDELYRTGWSAERLLDEASVISTLGEDIGSVENIIISDRGRILGIIAEVGGFWDIGDTHVFVPWSQVRVSPTLDRVIVPVTEENADDYSYFPIDVLTRFDTNARQTVDDDLATGPRIWKATDLIDDYAYLRGNAGYGYVNDLIFSANGQLQAVVVNATGGYGGGYRAFPYNPAGWNAGAINYQLGYGEADITRLEPFRYNRLPNRVVMRENQASSAATPEGTAAAGDAVSVVPTRWTFRDIDADNNLELTDREFSRVGRDIYRRWDTTGDGRIDANEFQSGLYRIFDADRDDRISRGEFTRGWRNWGVGDQQVSYGTFAADGDGYLGRNEFRRGLDRSGYFGRWDADGDGIIAENEFDRGLYDVWDADSDNVLARNEFNRMARSNW